MNEKRFYSTRLITYRPYTSEDFERIQQAGKLTTQQRLEIAVIAHIFPFKTNNYVINELIGWNDPLKDAMFRFAFPQRKMLPLTEYNEMTETLFRGASANEIQSTARGIRLRLGLNADAFQTKNPVQMSGIDVPFLHHRPDNTLAFLPAQARNTYAWCAFCPGWPQYTTNQPAGDPEIETEALTHFLRLNPNVKKLVLTGGEPLAIRTTEITSFLNAALNNAPQLECIQIETRSLAQWPYRFFLDHDANDLLNLFETIVHSGIRLVIHENFSLPVELSTKAVSLALQQLKKTGADIQTQSPLLAGINDTPDTLATLWKKQASMGCAPQDLVLIPFKGLPAYHLPMVKAFEVYQQALAQANNNKPANGLVINTPAGKIEMTGVSSSGITFKFIQGRNPEWNEQSFSAAYDEHAIAVAQLKPALGSTRFFFEEELKNVFGLRFSHES